MLILKIIQKKTLIIFVLLTLFLPAERLAAQEVIEPPNNCNDIKVGEVCGVDIDKDGIDDIQIKNTGVVNGKTKLESKSLKPTQIGGSQYIQSSSIPSLVAFYYKYAVALITILTTIMIIIAGVIWTTSAGNAEKITRAKQMISRSFTGMIIALGSYTLLYTINPDLVEFGNLQVIRIDKFESNIPEDYTIPTEGATSGSSNLVSLDGISNVSFAPGIDRKAAPAIKDALIKAMDQFNGYKSGGVIINFGVRTAAQQYDILSRRCGCKTLSVLLPILSEKKVTSVTKNEWKSYCGAELGTAKCPASYSTLILKITGDTYTFDVDPRVGHFAGMALDMGSTKGSYQACGNIPSVDVSARDSKGVPNAGPNAIGDVCIPKEQQKLIKAMIDNGFCVGLKNSSSLREPWHFELDQGQSTKPGSFCTSDKNDANLQKLYYFQNPTKN